MSNYFRLIIPQQAWMEFTKEGFRKVKLPQDLYVEIFGHYSQGFNPNQVTEEYTFYDDQFDLPIDRIVNNDANLFFFEIFLIVI